MVDLLVYTNHRMGDMYYNSWKQKSGWIQIFPASGVPYTFPFLSQPSVCLLVSRVRAYLTTDQQMISLLTRLCYAR